MAGGARRGWPISMSAGNNDERHACLLEGHTAGSPERRFGIPGSPHWNSVSALAECADTPGIRSPIVIRLSLNACRLRAEILFQTGGYAESRGNCMSGCRESHPDDRRFSITSATAASRSATLKALRNSTSRSSTRDMRNPQVYRNLGFRWPVKTKSMMPSSHSKATSILNPGDSSRRFLAICTTDAPIYGPRHRTNTKKVLEVQPSRTRHAAAPGRLLSASAVGFGRALGMNERSMLTRITSPLGACPRGARVSGDSHQRARTQGE